jgi:hypothetical protein
MVRHSILERAILYRVTGFELVEFQRDGKTFYIETAHQETKFLTEAELVEYSKTHTRFKVETVKYEKERQA